MMMRWVVLAIGLLNPRHSAQAQTAIDFKEPPPPLVGIVSEDHLVIPLAAYFNNEWRPIPTDSFGLPPFGMPSRWYQLRPNAPPLQFHGGTIVKVLMSHPEIGDWWELGQLLDQPWDLPARPLPAEGAVMVDSLMNGGLFVIDSSRATREGLSPLLERLFPDSFAVPDPTGRRKELRRGRAALNRVTVHRTLRTRRDKTSLMLVEAVRCVGTSEFGPCSMTLVFHAWLRDEGGRFQLLGSRGPLLTDEDFKSGGSNLQARAWFELGDRRFVVVREGTYLFVETFVAEILPTGVRPISRQEPPNSP